MSDVKKYYEIEIVYYRMKTNLIPFLHKMNAKPVLK